jgi:hypothetical protein
MSPGGALSNGRSSSVSGAVVNADWLVGTV